MGRISLRALLAGSVLAAAVAVGAWLRWRYVTDVSLYVDEFTTLWAAERIRELGAPRMPSGVLYTRGLLWSYIEAAALALFGSNYTVGRLPSLLTGLLTIGAVWLVGRRAWRTEVGLLAAVGLALLPEAIIWSGRARFYSLLQLMTLLTLWAAFEGLAHGGANEGVDAGRQRRLWRLFALCFVLALYAQEMAVLLYPSILLATVIWRGWRFLRRREVALAHAVCLLAMLVRYTIEILGQPGYFETIQATRPYVGLVFDVGGAWAIYGPLFVGAERLPWTLLGLAAVGRAIWELRRSGRLEALPRFHQATLFFGLHLGFLLAVVFALVGVSWRDARYLFWVQTFWLLLGAAGAVWLLMGLPGGRAVRWPALAGVTALLALSLWSVANHVTDQEIEGYDRVLAAVKEVRQPGDVVLSPQPPACALVLGPCDFYAVQIGYEEYVIQRDGVWVDRWSGAQLLNTAAQLEQVLRSAPRVWFITDSLRLATRYESDFIRTVVEQFDIAVAERGVLALRAEGWRTPPAVEVARTLEPPLPFGPLALAGVEHSAAQPGSSLAVTLLWRSVEPVEAQINSSLRLVDATGRQVAQDDGPPARGILPTQLIFDTPIPDPKRLALPGDLAPGRYRLDVVAYTLDPVTPLGEPQAAAWLRVGPAPAAPQQTVDGEWEDNMRLAGMDPAPVRLAPGELLDVRLVWTADGPVEHDYTVFVHLTGPDGSTAAQHDRAPEGGFYPTSAWSGGTAVEETYTLALPTDLRAGEYVLEVGLYRADTGERLPLASGGDSLALQSIRVTRP